MYVQFMSCSGLGSYKHQHGTFRIPEHKEVFENLLNINFFQKLVFLKAHNLSLDMSFLSAVFSMLIDFHRIKDATCNAISQQAAMFLKLHPHFYNTRL
jgi:hypothetical protein